MQKLLGVYIIRSKCKPDRCYIGSAVYIRNRWAMHLNDLKKNRHHSSKLQNHYNKYGRDDLDFSVLMCCERDKLIETEQFFIDAYKPFFNSRMKAESTLGLKWTDESRKKLSDACKGRVPWNKGLKTGPMSDEFKQKRREYQTGKTYKWSEASKDKIRGSNNHNYGKKPYNYGIKVPFKARGKRKNKVVDSDANKT